MITTAGLICLALNIYHEARGESIQGQRAVAHVTLNRAKQRKMKVCVVVFEPSQFSWTYHDPRVTDEEAWAKAMAIARRAAKRADTTGGANHYHARSVQPRWAGSMKVLAVIGQHVFYTDRES